MQMYCPQCGKIMDQTKSFWMKNGRVTDEPCVRCSKCGLVERPQSQKQEQRQQKLENKVLQNKGWKI